MRPVLLDVPGRVIADRRRRGLDRRDEVWEGVYHMVPPPDFEHQRVAGDLFELLRAYCRRHRLGVIHFGLGVRDLQSAEENYRIPEWVFLRSGRENLLRAGSGYVDEGPDAVLEVRSPGDETDEKIPFYERVGVGEMIIVERNPRRVHVLRLRRRRLRPVAPDTEGWVRSESLRVRFRTGRRVGQALLIVHLDLDGVEHAV